MGWMLENCRASRRPQYVRKPHLRAKIGDTLFQLFLHPDEQAGASATHPLKEFSQACVSALYNHVAAQQHLAPCLMELYGDVEHTGFYEKAGFLSSALGHGQMTKLNFYPCKLLFLIDAFLPHLCR